MLQTYSLQIHSQKRSPAPREHVRQSVRVFPVHLQSIIYLALRNHARNGAAETCERFRNASIFCRRDVLRIPRGNSVKCYKLWVLCSIWEALTSRTRGLNPSVSCAMPPNVVIQVRIERDIGLQRNLPGRGIDSLDIDLSSFHRLWASFACCKPRSVNSGSAVAAIWIIE